MFASFTHATSPPRTSALVISSRWNAVSHHGHAPDSAPRLSSSQQRLSSSQQLAPYQRR